MATLEIHDVPQATLDALRERARESGLSLNGYLLHELTRAGDQPTMTQLLHGMEQCRTTTMPMDVARTSMDQ